jgi:hypothetical protein
MVILLLQRRPLQRHEDIWQNSSCGIFLSNTVMENVKEAILKVNTNAEIEITRIPNWHELGHGRNL